MSSLSLELKTDRDRLIELQYALKQHEPISGDKVPLVDIYWAIRTLLAREIKQGDSMSHE